MRVIIKFSYLRWLGMLVLLLSLAGCATSPPKNMGNLCAIYEEKRSWYKAALTAQERWGVPHHVTMAFIHQESRFNSRARPGRHKILWIFPGPRKSNAYGYAQALKETWADYQRQTDNPWADRDDFYDAVDFIGWYNNASYRKNKIKKDDAYRLYLAYHEGHGGYARRTYQNKAWLLEVSRKVERRSETYRQQFAGCKKSLANHTLFDWLF